MPSFASIISSALLLSRVLLICFHFNIYDAFMQKIKKVINIDDQRFTYFNLNNLKTDKLTSYLLDLLEGNFLQHTNAFKK